MKELSKEEILMGHYKYPSRLITLKPTNHAFDRLTERGIGTEFLPKLVRVTKDNIQSGKTWDNEHLGSVVIKLAYNNLKDVFLCLNPYDGGLKSIWFRYKIFRNKKWALN